MVRWVDSLGAEIAKTAVSLVCFQGLHKATGRRRDTIALLIFSRQKPTIHFYAICDIKAGISPDAATVERMPDGLPFVASVRVGHSRMSTLLG